MDKSPECVKTASDINKAEAAKLIRGAGNTCCYGISNRPGFTLGGKANFFMVYLCSLACLLVFYF